MMMRSRPSEGLLRLVLALLMLAALLGAVEVTPRPEDTLLQLLTRPFAPTEAASADCLRDSQTYFTELSKYKPWALQMYDASAKISPGIITGNIQQLGNYDECLRIKTNEKFGAQACSASVQFEILNGTKVTKELDMKDLLLQVIKASDMNTDPEQSVDYEWMWCVPSSCNHTEISEAIELALDPLKVDGRLDFAVNINADSCHTSASDEHTFDLVDWMYTGVLFVFLAVIVVSTGYDLCTRHRIDDSQRKGAKHQLLTSFSLHTNGKKLFSTKRAADSINCLDGIRYLSICWIILGHTFYLEVVSMKLDRSRVMKLHEDWSAMLILNSNIVTDTFFLVSGVLLAYTSLGKRSAQAKPKLNVVLLYLNRYLRLTPAYALVVGFYATLFAKLGSGPKWDLWVTSSRQDCRANWWTNLLYINNYVNVAHICMSQTWYLSVDMQLLWLSPIFLYPMIKFNRSIYFWAVTCAGLVASVLLPFFITYFMQLTGTMLYYKNGMDVQNVYLQIYTRVYTRAGSYIIGLAFGYLLFKTKGYKIRMRKAYVWCGWLVAMVIGALAIVGPREMYFDDHQYNKLEASFYAGFHRHAFSIAVAWIIFTCVNGYAGFVNAFLSWRCFVPLSKLTYSAYLTHYIVLLYDIGSSRTAGELTGFTALHKFFGNLSLSMFMALVVFCCFESPFTSISRLLLGRRPSAPGLAGKPSAECIFRSTDSAESIGRSNDDMARSNATSVESVFVLGKDHCCVSVEPSKPSQQHGKI